MLRAHWIRTPTRRPTSGAGLQPTTWRYAPDVGKKSADDVARELLFTDPSERQAHRRAVQQVLARNASMRTNDELIEEQCRIDPAFRAEWERTAVPRSVAVAMISFRVDQGLTQRDLAERLGVSPAQVAEMELGDVAPEREALDRLTSLLGIDFTVDSSPS